MRQVPNKFAKTVGMWRDLYGAMEASLSIMRSQFFLIIVLTALLWGAAVAQTNAGTIEEGDGRQVSVSRDKFLRLIEQLIAAGRLQEAQKLVSQLPAKGAAATDRLFLSAKIAQAQGDYRRAEKLFRRILKDNPDLHRVRLELAFSLFRRRNYEAADYHFRLVMAAKIPDTVRRNIQSFLGRIRTDRCWDASFTIAIVPDSNINSGPSTKTVDIFGLPFQLSENASEKSGVGLQTVLDGEARPRIAENVRFAIGGGISSLDFPGRDFDDQSISLRAGPTITAPRGELAIYGQAFQRWFAGDIYSHGHGVLVRTNYDVAYDLGLDGWASYLTIDNESNDGLDGWLLSVGGTTTHTVDERGFFRLLAGWTLDRREDPANSNRLYRLGAGLSRELPWGLIGYIAPEIRYRPYDAPSPLFGVTRTDRTYRVEGKLLFARAVFPDLAPFISVSYEYNRSNIDFYSYRKFAGSIGFTKRF